VIQDQAIDKFRSLKPLQYGFLEALELSRSVGPEGCSDFHCRLVLTGGLDSGASRLVLTFVGVRDIKIGRLEGLFKFALDILSIRDHQLEDLNYRIIEREYDALFFSCRDFDANILAP
jgi:hypothetical protein